MAVPRHAGMNRSDIGAGVEKAVNEPVSEVITRRSALRAIALPLAVAVPVALLGCSREPKCDDTSALPPEAKKSRVEVAGYVELSTDFMKRCDRCAQFVPGGEQQCGTCKIVEGPINPKGTCKLFVAKT